MKEGDDARRHGACIDAYVTYCKYMSALFFSVCRLRALQLAKIRKMSVSFPADAIFWTGALPTIVSSFQQIDFNQHAGLARFLEWTRQPHKELVASARLYKVLHRNFSLPPLQESGVVPIRFFDLLAGYCERDQQRRIADASKSKVLPLLTDALEEMIDACVLLRSTELVCVKIASLVPEQQLQIITSSSWMGDAAIPDRVDTLSYIDAALETGHLYAIFSSEPGIPLQLSPVFSVTDNIMAELVLSPDRNVIETVSVVPGGETSIIRKQSFTQDFMDYLIGFRPRPVASVDVFASSERPATSGPREPSPGGPATDLAELSEINLQEPPVAAPRSVATPPRRTKSVPPPDVIKTSHVETVTATDRGMTAKIDKPAPDRHTVVSTRDLLPAVPSFSAIERPELEQKIRLATMSVLSDSDWDENRETIAQKTKTRLRRAGVTLFAILSVWIGFQMVGNYKWKRKNVEDTNVALRMSGRPEQELPVSFMPDKFRIPYHTYFVMNPSQSKRYGTRPLHGPVDPRLLLKEQIQKENAARRASNETKPKPVATARQSTGPSPDTKSRDNKIEYDVRSIYRESSNAVVSIQVLGLYEQELAQGTGFLVSSDGYIVTNQHVIENRGVKINVKLKSGDTLEAHVVTSLPDYDIALLRIQKTHVPFLHLADATELEVGETVVAIGSPFGLESTMTRGIISATCRVHEHIAYLQTDVPINPGNSGGPLLNSEGKVVGIVTATLFLTQGLSFAVPSNYLADVRELGSRYKHLSQKTNVAFKSWLDQAASQEQADGITSEKIAKLHLVLLEKDRTVTPWIVLENEYKQIFAPRKIEHFLQVSLNIMYMNKETSELTVLQNTMANVKPGSFVEIGRYLTDPASQKLTPIYAAPLHAQSFGANDCNVHYYKNKIRSGELDVNDPLVYVAKMREIGISSDYEIVYLQQMSGE